MEDLITRCPHCRQKVRVAGEGLYRCPSCRNTFRFRLDAPPPAEAAPIEIQAPSPGPACENCRQRPAEVLCRECGRFLCRECAITDARGDTHCADHAIERDPLRVLRGLFAHPVATFGAMDSSGRFFVQAVLFGGIAGVAQFVIGMIWEWLIPSPLTAFFERQMSAIIPHLPFDTNADVFDSMAAVITSPFYVLAGLFFLALVLHFCYLLVGGGKSGLAATVKVVFYAQAAALFAVVPWVGPLLCNIFQFVLLVIGGAKLHRVSYARSTIALLIPLVALIILGVVALLFFGELLSQFVPASGGKFI